MKSVYALYSNGDAAQRAVNSLRSAGYADHDITVISAAPMEEYEFSHIGHHSFQWYIACGGALLGLLFIAGGLVYLRATLRGKFEVWAETLDALGLRGDEDALDLGCGRGAVARRPCARRYACCGSAGGW